MSRARCPNASDVWCSAWRCLPWPNGNVTAGRYGCCFVTVMLSGQWKIQFHMDYSGKSQVIDGLQLENPKFWISGSTCEELLVGNLIFPWPDRRRSPGKSVTSQLTRPVCFPWTSGGDILVCWQTSLGNGRKMVVFGGNMKRFLLRGTIHWCFVFLISLDDHGRSCRELGSRTWFLPMSIMSPVFYLHFALQMWDSHLQNTGSCPVISLFIIPFSYS